MFRSLIALLVLLVASAAHAQVPQKQARIFFDSVSQDNGCGVQQETWQIMSGTCAAPGTTPWISTVRVRIGSTTLDVPRANVTRLTTTAECSPNAAPCLRVNPMTIPAGSVTVAFVSNAGNEGEPSTAVPFSPVAELPSAPATLRVVPVP